MLKMFDTEMLIELVGQYPEIWDKSTKEYGEKSCRDRAWQQIGKSMFSDWDDVSAQGEMIYEMKHKWKNVRDAFIKSYNLEKSDDGLLKKKKYIHRKALTFLIPTIDRDFVPDESADLTVKEEISTEQDPLTGTGSSVSPKRMLNVSRLKRTNRDIQLRKRMLFNNKRRASQQSDDDSLDHYPLDGDKCFLLSLLPDVKKLSYNQKSQFKMMCVKFFHQVHLNLNCSQSATGCLSEDDAVKENATTPTESATVIRAAAEESKPATAVPSLSSFPALSTRRCNPRSSLRVRFSNLEKLDTERSTSN